MPDRDEIERGKQIPADQCPRRYCFFWGNWFAWEKSIAEGCGYDGSCLPSEHENREHACCRCDPNSPADHYDPNGPNLLEDGVSVNIWQDWSLSKEFNDQFGHLDWKDSGRIIHVIIKEILNKVAADNEAMGAVAVARTNPSYYDDKTAHWLERERALRQVIASMPADYAALSWQFDNNPSFRKWLTHRSFWIGRHTI